MPFCLWLTFFRHILWITGGFLDGKSYAANIYHSIVFSLQTAEGTRLFHACRDTGGFETPPLVLPLLLHAYELVMTRFLSGELCKYFLFLMYLRSVCR